MKMGNIKSCWQTSFYAIGKKALIKAEHES